MEPAAAKNDFGGGKITRLDQAKHDLAQTNVMKMHPRIVLLSVALATLTASGAARAASIIPSPAEQRVEIHGEAGLTFASGMENVLDQMETNFGVDRDFVWPIALRLAGYVKYPNGFGLGAVIGPCQFIRVENDYDNYHHRYHNDDDQWSYIIPITADVRYYLPSRDGFTPYGRAGVSFPIAGGDHIGQGTPGPVVAVGATVWEHRWIAIGVEAGYDGSKVKVKTGEFHAAAKVRPVEFTFSVFAHF